MTFFRSAPKIREKTNVRGRESYERRRERTAAIEQMERQAQQLKAEAQKQMSSQMDIEAISQMGNQMINQATQTM